MGKARWVGFWTLLLLSGVVHPSSGQPTPAVSTNSTSAATPSEAILDTVLLPLSVPDPIEPLNRIFWGINRGLLIGVVKPTSKVYRFIVRKPLRKGIRNFARNATYPGRLINHLLQGKWASAHDETDRFLCNTIAGVGGIFDVASRWKIPKSDADFGQTFGQWGWKPGCYLMLPIFGPSNERDALGLATDTAADPLTYLSPYPFDSGNPFTYVSPYTYYSYGVVYNDLTETVDDHVRFTKAEMDPYSMIQYAWTFVRENRVADFQLKGEQDEPSLESLQSVFFSFRDPKFPDRGKTRSVFIPATGKKLKYTSWMQPGEAPVVYIAPGLGSHRLAAAALALAELVYEQGYSAVCVSSVYNFEFMKQASTAAMPAYTPVDARDLHVAFSCIDRQLEKLYPNRVGARALMGYSMGGFHSLFIAAGDWTNQSSLLKFDRVVAINPPVRLPHGISQLDDYFQAPLEWPVEERTERIQNTFLKIAALGKNSLTPQGSLPFSAVESKFLIGLTFRFILRDVIFTSQQRTNQGVLKQPLTKLRRNPVYQEIMQYSYRDYLEKFLIPYYQTRGLDLTMPGTLEQAGDLRSQARVLQTNSNIRLVLNRNDFLLADEDLEWLESTFDPDQIKVFEKGGHLGNLTHPEVQKAILHALDGLKTDH